MAVSQVTPRGRRYLLIPPCRNEAEFAERTLRSVVRQSVPPARWIIVDDGSSDETPRLLAEYARAYPFIEIVTREDRGRRSVGPGVIESFYAGYARCKPADYDYLCKLDLDLELPEDYFETLIAKMEANSRLGSCSGKPVVRDAAGRLVPEPCGDE